jgi:thiamine monophosphate kinase
LATAGDDYEIVCTAHPDHVDALVRAADKAGPGMTVIGRVTAERGVRVHYDGEPVAVDAAGWRHV